MERIYKVVINDNGKIKDYRFSDCDAICAINFAMGFAECMAREKDLHLNRPCTQILGGFKWWSKNNEFTIEVLNADGEVVCMKNCPELGLQ